MRPKLFYIHFEKWRLKLDVRLNTLKKSHCLSFIALPRRLAWFLHQTFDRTTVSIPLSKLITVNKLLRIQCQTQSTIENYIHIHTVYSTTALQKKTKRKKKSEAPFHSTSGLNFSNSLCVMLGLNCASSENKQTHRKKCLKCFILSGLRQHKEVLSLWAKLC